MINIVSKPWTYSLIGGTLTIDKVYDLNVISVLASAGSVTITGGKISNGVGSQPITLLQGQSVTISSGNDNTIPLSDITITTAGTASIIAR